MNPDHPTITRLRDAIHRGGTDAEHAAADPADGMTDRDGDVVSAVRLPANVDDEFEVYVNGVLLLEDSGYEVCGRILRFERRLMTDRVSRWRWALGAWGVGTYRQDDTVDVRYEVDGVPKLAHALPILQLDG